MIGYRDPCQRSSISYGFLRNGSIGDIFAELTTQAAVVTGSLSTMHEQFVVLPDIESLAWVSRSQSATDKPFGGHLLEGSGPAKVGYAISVRCIMYNPYILRLGSSFKFRRGGDVSEFTFSHQATLGLFFFFFFFQFLLSTKGSSCLRLWL